MSGDEINLLRLRLDQIIEEQQQFRELMRESRKVMYDMAEQQTRIMTALTGDDLGTKGVIPRQDAAEKELVATNARIDQIDRRLVRWGGIVAGASLALGLFKDAIVSLVTGGR